MKIYLYDKSTLTCDTVEFGNGTAVVDEYLVIFLSDIIRITD